MTDVSILEASFEGILGPLVRFSRQHVMDDLQGCHFVNGWIGIELLKSIHHRAQVKFLAKRPYVCQCCGGIHLLTHSRL